MLRAWLRCAESLMIVGLVIFAVTIMVSRSNNRGLILFGAHRDDFIFRLYMLDMNTGAVQLLRDDPASEFDGSAAWSPAGAVTFMSFRDGHYDIYAWTPAHVRQLTSRSDNYFPFWSPDGSKIAFASYRSGSWNLYLMKLRGSEIRRIAPFGGSSWDIAWSHDGQRIAFTAPDAVDKELFIADSVGGDVVRVTDNHVEDSTPSWSPDGTRVVWSSGDYRGTNLLVYDLTTGETMDLTHHRSLNYSPSWSPDGARIAFLSSRDETSGDQIYVMNADGGSPRNVTHSDVTESFPSWSPDGSEILFISTRDGRFDLYALNLENETTRRLTEMGTLDMGWRPQWLP